MFMFRRGSLWMRDPPPSGSLPRTLGPGINYKSAPRSGRCCLKGSWGMIHIGLTESLFSRCCILFVLVGVGACTPANPEDLAVCGNGFVEAGEDCDDGDLNNFNECPSTCRFDEPEAPDDESTSSTDDGDSVMDPAQESDGIPDEETQSNSPTGERSSDNTNGSDTPALGGMSGAEDLDTDEREPADAAGDDGVAQNGQGAGTSDQASDNDAQSTTSGGAQSGSTASDGDGNDGVGGTSSSGESQNATGPQAGLDASRQESGGNGTGSDTTESTGGGLESDSEIPSEDANGNGILDTEDVDGDGRLDLVAEDIDGDGQLDDTEDLDGDGHFDVDEDTNGNGLLDAGEDRDGDGRLDGDEDLDGDGYFDNINEDSNGNGQLDDGEDLDNDGRLDTGEDRDGDGRLDVDEDLDDDGVLDTEDLDGDGVLDGQGVEDSDPQTNLLAGDEGDGSHVGAGEDTGDGSNQDEEDLGGSDGHSTQDSGGSDASNNPPGGDGGTGGASDDETSDTGEPLAAPCTLDEVIAARDCLLNSCGDAANLALCALTACSGPLNAASPECRSCAIGNANLGNVNTVVDFCLSVPGSGDSDSGEPSEDDDDGAPDGNEDEDSDPSGTGGSPSDVAELTLLAIPGDNVDFPALDCNSTADCQGGSVCLAGSCLSNADPALPIIVTQAQNACTGQQIGAPCDLPVPYAPANMGICVLAEELELPAAQGLVCSSNPAEDDRLKYIRACGQYCIAESAWRDAAECMPNQPLEAFWFGQLDCPTYCRTKADEYASGSLSRGCFAAEAQQYDCLARLSCEQRHEAVSNFDPGLPCRLENNLSDYFCFDLAFEVVSTSFATACSGLSVGAPCGPSDTGRCYPSGSVAWLVDNTTDYTTLVCVSN